MEEKKGGHIQEELILEHSGVLGGRNESII